jgi:hypothetical protein
MPIPPSYNPTDFRTPQYFPYALVVPETTPLIPGSSQTPVIMTLKQGMEVYWRVQNWDISIVATANTVGNVTTINTNGTMVPLAADAGGEYRNSTLDKMYHGRASGWSAQVSMARLVFVNGATVTPTVGLPSTVDFYVDLKYTAFSKKSDFSATGFYFTGAIVAGLYLGFYFSPALPVNSALEVDIDLPDGTFTTLGDDVTPGATSLGSALVTLTPNSYYF